MPKAPITPYGRPRIWTYDYPDNQVQAIAIDPRQVAITKTITGLGKDPGHSLVVLPDKKTAAVNVAGDSGQQQHYGTGLRPMASTVVWLVP